MCIYNIYRYQDIKIQVVVEGRILSLSLSLSPYIIYNHIESILPAVSYGWNFYIHLAEQVLINFGCES